MSPNRTESHTAITEVFRNPESAIGDTPSGQKKAGAIGIPFFPTAPGPLGGAVCYPLHVGEHVTKSDEMIYRDRVGSSDPATCLDVQVAVRQGDGKLLGGGVQGEYSAGFQSSKNLLPLVAIAFGGEVL